MNPKEQPTLYGPELLREKEKPRLSLMSEQKDAVRRITLGVEEVDETARQMAKEDVIKTLENGHSLNRLITNEAGDIIGYIACEDFVPKEAYIKYFATTGATRRNLFKWLQPLYEWLQIGMKQISIRDGDQKVFNLVWRHGGLWLDGASAEPENEWSSGGEFVFCLRKLET